VRFRDPSDAVSRKGTWEVIMVLEWARREAAVPEGPVGATGVVGHAIELWRDDPHIHRLPLSLTSQRAADKRDSPFVYHVFGLDFLARALSCELRLPTRVRRDNSR
jgi:hypothetical protein